MGKDASPWRTINLDPDGKIRLPGYGRKRSSSALYPFTLPLNPSLVPPSNPAEKSYVVFDQSGDRTNLVFSSFPVRNTEAAYEEFSSFPARNAEDAYEENSEDIDALLYSDSDNESKVSTGHSPVAGSSVVLTPSPPPQLPTKRRRVEREPDTDPSLADTASSAPIPTPRGTKSKRERIKESVGVIRRLIPGWRKAKKKDAMSVLDEAIKYLNSLRLITKELGARYVSDT